ncbi:L-serine ammonia-lyase [Cytophaga sp. FL35]|uniref:L-serine ammonia-lyase n=1 Tax=Cytophaga sp. FL35 TaxID=1904456 RepID=UPI001653ABBE|nr:L-serine ammonia-lyase [Cytophaga sp. FL35]MBC6998766.1 L-serine ammonia-lyase [Cytophaga sp. FL35]
MECISVFDMLKIGVGPSSSHTLGPWRAAERWIQELQDKGLFSKVRQVKVHVYGSLSLTGKGHATDYAIMLGLSGADPVAIPEKDILPTVHKIQETKKIHLGSQMEIPFSPLEDICFHKKFLEFHANGLKFEAVLETGDKKSKTYYSIGGGFVVVKERKNAKKKMADFHKFPFPVENGTQLLAHCEAQDSSISSLVLKNERSLRTDKEIDTGIHSVWNTMLDCMYNGCHTHGKLPGGLNVTRRAADLNKSLLGENYKKYKNAQGWLETIRKTKVKFRQIFKWVSCFALAVNEVNASLGRVVTAPTNGSAGVIPSVLMYYLVIENHKAGFEHIKQFLLVAGEIGSIFKKGATISAAMGGCQAEIGVSSAMAAGALTELLGGSPGQVLMAAEIAMEHHLGLTCDPIGGLVQIPCIERNSMGAIKAITAAELALESNPEDAKVPLDKVVETMWETAKDMNSKYKETSKGGLAVGINMSDC